MLFMKRLLQWFFSRKFPVPKNFRLRACNSLFMECRMSLLTEKGSLVLSELEPINRSYSNHVLESMFIKYINVLYYIELLIGFALV